MGSSQRDFMSNLYAQQSKGMIRFARSVLLDEYLADEAVQETFAVALKKVDLLSTMENPTAWLFGVLKVMFKRIRANERKLQKLFVSIDEPMVNTPYKDEDLESNVLLTSLITSEEFRILEKIYLHGYTYQEVADDLGIPLSTVGMRVKRAKEKFKEKYDK